MNQRLKLVQTASASNGVPSWNVTPLAQLERVGAAFVALGPFGGQQRRGLAGGLVDAHEAFEDLPGDAVGLDVGDQGRVEAQRLRAVPKVKTAVGAALEVGEAVVELGAGPRLPVQEVSGSTRRTAPMLAAIRRTVLLGTVLLGTRDITSGNWMVRRLRNSPSLVDSRVRQLLWHTSHDPQRPAARPPQKAKARTWWYGPSLLLVVQGVRLEPGRSA